MSWMGVGTMAIGAAGSYLSNKKSSKAAEQAAAEGQTAETARQATLPEWAEPYVTGSRIRQWDMPVMSQEYKDWAGRMGEGQFANQDAVNQILSFDQLTGGGAAGGTPQMANLLGIGSQYSQLPPEMFQQRPAGQGDGGGEMNTEQMTPMDYAMNDVGTYYDMSGGSGGSGAKVYSGEQMRAMFPKYKLGDESPFRALHHGLMGV